MKKAILWLLDYWRVPFLLLVVGATWWFTRKSRADQTPLTDLRLELDAIEAARKARIGAAMLGKERMVETLKEKHDLTIKRLDEEGKKKAEELRENPGQLAKFLVRAGRTR